METITEPVINTNLSKENILNDYYIAYLSRQLSIAGRKEVLGGRASFGIFGDGKEVAQVAIAKFFREGDWRSGYYRDQTFMLAKGIINTQDFFAQLYGTVDKGRDPNRTGKNFNNHFATPNVDNEGNWLNLAKRLNSAGDISPTAGQMPRLLGLGYASRLFRNNKELQVYDQLSRNGNEVAFGTIGEAGTSEGLFWETLNAACVLQIPVAISIWDDGYGISVPVTKQTVKGSISEALKGFANDWNGRGCLLYTGKGWDYAGLCEIFETGISQCRQQHIPVVFHITEMTQPLGHSTSGSHNRYKSEKRLEWEKKYDPVTKMREWIISEKIATADSVDEIEENAKSEVQKAMNHAWEDYSDHFREEKKELLNLIDGRLLNEIDLDGVKDISAKDIVVLARKLIDNLHIKKADTKLKKDLISWFRSYLHEKHEIYDSYLYSETSRSSINVREVKPEYGTLPAEVTGRELLKQNFDYLFSKYPLLLTFGEDTGKIGDVEQGLKGLQEKYGELRVSDTGIREASIIGQGIGLALRGLRPIAEIQYLDYLIYALNVISDDLASTHYRTSGRQAAPLIIRTRGHRLIGIWHSGSPLGMIVNSVRGVFVCVPRNMTQAAGFYNALLEGNDPAIVIEPLRAYSMKELLPSNTGEYKVPLGVPEIIEEGKDITLVTYGWCVHIARLAVADLRQTGISVELIDVQTLLPFDVNHVIKKSVEKTNHLIIMDEDLPGGATAFIMQQVVEVQKAFYCLDAPPVTITGSEHRPAYGPDGDYFSKPGREDVINAAYKLMHRRHPDKFPKTLFV